MCRINCSGGCPECAPDEHLQPCVEGYDDSEKCVCNKLANRVINVPSKIQNPSVQKQGLMVGTCVFCGGWLGGPFSQDLYHMECLT